MPLQVEKLTSGAVVVNRGPLNYAVEISHTDTTTFSWRYVSPWLNLKTHSAYTLRCNDRNPQALADTERLFPAITPNYTTPFIHQDHDHTLLPTMDWRIAIDPATIAVKDKSAHIAAMPYYAWAPGAQPVTLTASACNIEWEVVKNAAGPLPSSPNACLGDVFNVTLAPFAAAKVRIGEIPTMVIS
jgi:hypothetical protein